MNSINTPHEQSLAPENEWHKTLREKYFARCLPSAFQYQFCTAVRSIQYYSLINKARARYEFEYCLSGLEQIYLIARLLREEGHSVKMHGESLSGEEYSQDLRGALFFSLNRRTRAILRKQGIKK